MPEDSSSQPTPRWIVDWNLDLCSRMVRGEPISREEVEALDRAMGRKTPSPEEARALIEECFGKPAEQVIFEIQNRHN